MTEGNASSALDGARWVKATASQSGQGCVEIAVVTRPILSAAGVDPDAVSD